MSLGPQEPEPLRKDVWPDFDPGLDQDDVAVRQNRHPPWIIEPFGKHRDMESLRRRQPASRGLSGDVRDAEYRRRLEGPRQMRRVDKIAVSRFSGSSAGKTCERNGR